MSGRIVRKRGLSPFLILALSSGAAVAQDRTEPAPKALERVGVEEKLDAALPLAATFKDEAGRDVTLGSYFQPRRPVILTLNYYRCPMLCTLELNGLVNAMTRLRFQPGRDYEVVTVSFDPREMPALAAAKKASYIGLIGKPEAAAGWHFLTGSRESIEALTKAAGFSVEYDAKIDQYGHAAVVMLATPDGRIGRYLYGVEFPPDTLQLALLEAGKGKIGSTWERFILYCYHYDAEAGRYAPAAMAIMRAGGALTVLILAVVIGGFWLRDRARAAALPRGGRA